MLLPIEGEEDSSEGDAEENGNRDPNRPIQSVCQGAWRLGLQHPGYFAALEASAGYVETKEYAGNRLPKPGRIALTPMLNPA